MHSEFSQSMLSAKIVTIKQSSFEYIPMYFYSLHLLKSFTFVSYNKNKRALSNICVLSLAK